MGKGHTKVPQYGTEQFTINVFTDDNYTHVLVLDERGVVVGQGNARRDPADSPDPEIGQTLAFGRAFRNIGEKAVKRANGLIKHADDVKLDRERRATQSTWGDWNWGDEPIDVELSDDDVAHLLLGLFSFLFEDSGSDGDAVHSS